MNSFQKEIHDKFAPYWAITLAILGSTGLATVFIKSGVFWNGYVLDMVGPAWNYILFRGLNRSYANNAWIRFFTPVKTVTLFILFCFGVEAAQYLNLYDSTFDPWDFLAYVSLLVPLFILDTFQQKFIRNKNLLDNKDPN